jgi:hypothetical protein
MLTASQLDAVPDNILKLYHEFEDSVITDMVRRLVKMDYVTSSAAWQMQRVIESGAVYEDVLKKLAGFTGKSEKELADAFSAAGVRSMKFDDSIYKAAGLNPLPLNLSPQMAQVLANGLKTTNGLMQNITRSTALSAQRQFLQASDLAYLQVSSGAFSYDQAIKAAVKGIGESGLGVVYPSGRVDQLDVAVRRAVLTGVGKTSGDLQLARASEMGQDLVETSAHAGARPTHAQWQGQVFSRSGTSKQYPDFATSTGFGTALGLNGINCRHSFYPFFEGISTAIYEKAELESYANKMVTYNGKKMTVYEATQEQRAIERQIRSFKRQENALQAGGLDASAEAAKVRDLQAKMRSFTKQTGLSRQGVREQVIVKESAKEAISTPVEEKTYIDLGRKTRYDEESTRTQREELWVKQNGGSFDRPQVSNKWVAGGNESLSRTLRRGGIPNPTDPAGVLFNDMQKYFENPKVLQDDILTYRGVGENINTSIFKELSPGDIFEDKSYTAVSLSRSIASGFGGRRGVTNIFAIQVDKGTAFLPGSPDEFEFVLNKASKFEVLNVLEYDSSTIYPWLSQGDLVIREFKLRLLNE